MELSFCKRLIPTGKLDIQTGPVRTMSWLYLFNVVKRDAVLQIEAMNEALNGLEFMEIEEDGENIEEEELDEEELY